MKTTKQNLVAVGALLLFSGMSAGLQAAPLPDGTVLTIEPGVGSAANIPCTTGSCMGKEAAPGFVVWNEIGPGSDGGIVIGKDQASGGQELAPSATNTTPGEMANAHYFFANYGTWYTPAGATNTFSITSCTGTDCLGNTVLNSINEAWNGNDIVFGVTCNSPLCTADQLAGSMVDQWIVNPDGSYELRYSNVLPNGNPSGFGNCPTWLILRGDIIQPQPLPQISGTWKSSVNDVVFLFGENMSNVTEVLINGVNLTHLIQPMGTDHRALLVLADGLKAPYTVKMTTTGGTAVFPEPCTL